MRRRAATATILLASLFAMPVFGAESAKAVKAALIEEYLQVTQAERTIEEALRLAFDQSDDQIRDSLGYSDIDLGEMDAEGKLEYEKAIAEQKEMMRLIVDRLLARVDLEALSREVSAPVLDRYFSADDLRALIAFCKTPTGQKRIENEAKIGVETQVATRKALMPLMTQIITELQKEKEEAEHQKHPWKRALADMRSIATAVEAYATDENKYPQAVTMSALESVISPTYIRNVPEKDPWGAEYVYMVSSDGAHYRIICGGADKSIDGTSRTIAEITEEESGNENKSMDDDIIYQDGMFLSWPPGSDMGYEE